jgi:hypothetical protein
MPSVDELVKQHGEETVRKAFWLQEEVFEQGIEGANFSDYSEKEMEQVKKILVKKAINDNTTRSL